MNENFVIPMSRVSLILTLTILVMKAFRCIYQEQLIIVKNITELK